MTNGWFGIMLLEYWLPYQHTKRAISNSAEEKNTNVWHYAKGICDAVYQLDGFASRRGEKTNQLKIPTLLTGIYVGPVEVFGCIGNVDNIF